VAGTAAGALGAGVRAGNVVPAVTNDRVDAGAGAEAGVLAGALAAGAGLVGIVGPATGARLVAPAGLAAGAGLVGLAGLATGAGLAVRLAETEVHPPEMLLCGGAKLRGAAGRAWGNELALVDTFLAGAGVGAGLATGLAGCGLVWRGGAEAAGLGVAGRVGYRFTPCSRKPLSSCAPILVARSLM